MLEAFKREWHRLAEGTPGRRYQDRHARAQQRRSSHVTRALRMVGGLVIAALGVFLMPAPGPGWAVFILGLGLVANDIKVVAKGLDWGELRARAALAWARRFWGRASPALRVIVSASLLTIVAVGGYGLFRLFVTH